MVRIGFSGFGILLSFSEHLVTLKVAGEFEPVLARAKILKKPFEERVM